MFIKILFFFLIINGVFGFIDLVIEDTAASADCQDRSCNVEFNNGTGFPTQNASSANIYDANDPNSNSTLVGELLNPTNSTDGSLWDWVGGQFPFAELESIRNFAKFFDGGFIFDAVDDFAFAIGVDFPEGFQDVLEILVGFSIALWLLFLFFSRGASSFT